MSTDLDLEDLENARDELASIVLDLAECGHADAAYPNDIARVVFRLGGIGATINRAIAEYGKPAERKGANDG